MAYLVKAISPQNGVTYLPRASGLSWRQSYPGGFESCSFTLPGKVELAPFSRLVVAKGPVAVFDGEIRDLKYQSGPKGAQTTVTAYGHAILLTDDLFGPKVYADTRTGSWRTYTRGGMSEFRVGTASVPPSPEKFTVRQDDTRLRIAAKPNAVFNGQGAPAVGPPTFDWEGFVFTLPVRPNDADAIVSLSFDYVTNFPTGSWALTLFQSAFLTPSFGMDNLVTATGSGTVTMTTTAGTWPALITSGGVPIARQLCLALRPTVDQAVLPEGAIDDGEGSSVAHTLEYGGTWWAQLNTGLPYPFPPSWRGRGGMISDHSTVSGHTDSTVQFAKDGSNFYPDGSSRVGAAARLRFTGRGIQWFARKWDSDGDVEVQIWNAAGTSVYGPVTVNLHNGTPSDAPLWQQLVLDWSSGTGGFGTYVMTLRNLGTVGGVTPTAPAGYYINVDHFLIKAGSTVMQGMRPFEDNELYVEIRNLSVKTTTSQIKADLVAQDVIAKYSAAGIGLSANTIRINESGATLATYNHLAYDDPVTSADVLDDVCSIGSVNDKPLAWWVFENKQLGLEEWDTTGARGLYLVRATDAEISHERTIQDDFALSVYPLYQDLEGAQRLGVAVASDRAATEYGSRTRRVAYQTGAGNTVDAAEVATTFLRSHDRPSTRTRVTIKGPITGQGGARVPLDEVRAGRLLRISGYDEWGRQGSTDQRGGLTGMITALDYNTEARTLTVELGDGPNDLSRMMARLERERRRGQKAG